MDWPTPSSSRIKEIIARYGSISAVVALAVGLRLLYLVLMQGTPGFVWIDPDGYLFRAWSLIGEDGAWRWNTDAVRYSGPYVKAPLYPLLLSTLEYSPRGYRWSAGVVHALLSALAVVGLWSLVRSLRSAKAGLLAALIYAVYFPSVVSMNVIMQERLYVPLLIVAFALLAWALKTGNRLSRFALAGLALGVAALARSMPLYFVGPAALLIAICADSWRRGLRPAGLFMAGFCAVTLPYSIFISGEVQQVVAIENVGAYGIARLDPEGERRFPNGGVEAPTAVQVALFTGSQFLKDPAAFLLDKVSLTSGAFRLGGGRWLDLYGTFPTAKSAFWGKIAAHSFGDILFAMFVLAAPFGFMSARQDTVAKLLALWVVTHLGMSAIAGYSGPRFREPVDWALLALAALLLSEEARPGLSRRRLVAALPPAILLGWTMVSSIKASVSGRADYGIGPWESDANTRTTTAEAAAGFKVPVVRGATDVVLKPAGSRLSTRVEVRIADQPSRTVMVTAGGYELRVPSSRDLAFVEVEPVAKGSPTGLLIEVRR
ncbi:MAG: glycosyltransferase family 39 protein [Vicinamibacteria bacterium]|nr:glycosyltransferase family 39 protein [Vicinamibacteria bacterium]